MSWSQKPRAISASEHSALQARALPREELLEIAGTGRLWAILDACDEPAVPPKMYERTPERAVSLYRGEAEISQAAIAPYLAHVDHLLLEWIQEELWEKPWGIFAVARQDLKTLRTHFRKFLTVKDPAGEKMYFRYYDPRVLKVFLTTCLDEELREFFGPLEGFGLGDTDHQDVVLFSWSG